MLHQTDIYQDSGRRACKNEGCEREFPVTDADVKFLEHISPVFNGKKEQISSPTLCPDCRLQRRMSFRNNIYVYHAKSAQTGKIILSRFIPTSPFPIVEHELWYSDERLPPEKAVPRFDQPVFAQLRALRNRTPYLALSLLNPENSDYCNNNTGVKNCYLVFTSSYAEDCMYCEQSVQAKDCIDCTVCPGCQLCYDCTGCSGCYNVQSSFSAEECSDSLFLSFCRSCKNCFGCANLSHKEYCIWNEQKTKEEYDAFMQTFHRSSFSQREEYRRQWESFCLAFPRPHAIQRQVENVDGNYIQNSKNIHDSVFISDAEDVTRGFGLYGGTKDVSDVTYFGFHVELAYECMQIGVDVRNMLFCTDCWGNNANLLYCLGCSSCHDCFGCVGLMKSSYCIFNSQYSKEEYEALVPKLIEHMRRTGEWGEFFPMTLSPYPYNHAIAQRYFPMTRQEVASAGMQWYDRDMEDAAQAMEPASLPDELPPDNASCVVKSARSGRPYRITTQELERYRSLGAPLPRLTYDERMEDRAKQLGGARLFDRTCAKTGKVIRTTYAPDSPYVIWDRDEWEKEFRG